MLERRLAERTQRPVVAHHGTARTRRALEQHADRAREHGPPFAVAGIERVVAFTTEVRPAMHIERRAVSRREDVEPLGQVRGIVLVVGLARWGEVERRAASLLVQVHRHMRPPLHVRAHAPFRLGVRLRIPVAIEIEVVVRRARPRPRPGVIQRAWLTRHTLRTAVALDVVRMPLASVRILVGVDQHQGAVERQLGVGIGTGGQLVQQRQPRFGARRFTTMHGVLEPHNAGNALHRRIDVGGTGPPRIGESLGIALDLLQPRHVGFARDGDDEHLASLERAGHGVHLHPLGGGGNALDVAHHGALRGETGADIVAQDLRGSRHARIERSAGVGEGMLCLRRAGRERAGEGRGGQREAEE